MSTQRDLDQLLDERLVERGLTREDVRRAGVLITSNWAPHGPVGIFPYRTADGRELYRLLILQKEIADPIALSLLKGDYHDGDVVVVDASSDGQLAFSRKAPVAAG